MLKILFSGDLSVTGVYRDAVERGAEIFDPGILDRFARHDFTVVNLEGPATAAKTITPRRVLVVNPPESIPYLAVRGITVFNCANNHMFDCGVEGFADTLRAIEAAGGQCFGAGFHALQAKRILYLSSASTTAALIGVCHAPFVPAASDTTYGTFYSTFRDIEQAVADARTRADYVILNYHGGEEYTTFPMPSRRRILRQYAELGIDMIVGHHSHVMQGHERHANCDIFYSLGNFIFDVDVLRTRQFTDKGALLSVSFGEKGVAFEFLPVECDLRNGRIVPGAPSFHEHIRQISSFADYRNQWRRDAYRTFSFTRRTDDACQPADQSPSRPRWRIWRLLLSPRTYLRLYRQLKNPNARPIVLAAGHEAICRWFRR